MLPLRLEPLACTALLLCHLGCGAPVAPAALPAEPPVPVPPAITTVTGCVESRELRAYVLALEQQRATARAHALATIGAQPETRRGRFVEPGAAALDAVVADGAQRWAVVGNLASGSEPVASLARAGQVIHRIDERPRAHLAPVLSCSEQRCSSARPAPASDASPRAVVRPLLIELAPGEALGPAIEVGYDYWRADVRYTGAKRCTPQAR